MKPKYTIEFVKKLAEKKGGKCLSSFCKNSQSKLIFQCSEGHQWTVPAIRINYHWCPKCGTLRCPQCKPKYTIEDMKKLAERKGGKCLSRVYTNCNKKLIWQCADGHKWKAKQPKIRRGGWCPYCSKYTTEEKCRFIFEQLTRQKFPKSKSVLVDGLELDGYCKNLNIAFEYNGEQHYKIFKHWHGKNGFSLQKDRDRKKKELCIQKKIDLIIISHFEFKTDKELKAFIEGELQTRDVKCKKRINLDLFYSNLSTLKDLQEVAKSRCGELLSRKYYGSKVKLKWKCKKGHIWEATPASVKNKRWCPACGGTKKLTLQHAIKLGKEKNGKCLSKVYVNSKSKLEWQCDKGHIWNASYSNVQNGKWCPFCIGRGKTVECLQKLAQKRNGKLLSTEYKNSFTKYKWQCSKGHIWNSTFGHMMRDGCWCPYCSGNKKTINDLYKLAIQKNGVCLAEQYINSRTHVNWQCEKGHVFSRTSDNVRLGRWCPICRKENRLKNRLERYHGKEKERQKIY